MILSDSVQSETKDKSHDRAEHLFPPLGLDLPQVELQLLALQHVAVRPAALAGPGGDGTQHTASQKLVDETLLNLAVLLSLLVLLVRLLRALLVEVGLLLLGQLGTLDRSRAAFLAAVVPSAPWRNACVWFQQTRRTASRVRSTLTRKCDDRPDIITIDERVIDVVLSDGFAKTLVQ